MDVKKQSDEDIVGGTKNLIEPDMENFLVSRTDRKDDVNLQLTWRLFLCWALDTSTFKRYCWSLESLSLLKTEEMNEEEFILTFSLSSGSCWN